MDSGKVKQMQTGFIVVLMMILFTASPQTRNHRVTIIAHRGAMVERPENTMAAYQRAAELGADMIEIDLRTSRDGFLYVLHDAHLDRTTRRQGDASELTLAELGKLDAGSWFDPIYSAETIPSFRQVLDWALHTDLQLLLDLKESGPGYNETVAAEVLSAGMEDRVIVGVRSPEQATEFNRLLPDARKLAFMGSADDIELYAEAGTGIMRVWLSWLDEDPALAGRVAKTNRKLMINGTQGDLEETRKIMSYEPDWILVDDPARLRHSLEELYPR
ncbi:MAG: glycerophosphodiester phosphodiesterase family protein [Balneolales bacterium]